MRTTESSNKRIFFKEHPEYSKFRKEYVPIFLVYKKLLWENLLKGKIYNTPLGSFEMVRFLPQREFKKLPIEWKESKEEGFILRHLNEHTDGYKCMLQFKYTAKKCTHRFKACRHFNRTMASFLKENKNNYKNYHEISKHK